MAIAAVDKQHGACSNAGGKNDTFVLFIASFHPWLERGKDGGGDLLHFAVIASVSLTWRYFIFLVILEACFVGGTVTGFAQIVAPSAGDFNVYSGLDGYDGSGVAGSSCCDAARSAVDNDGGNLTFYFWYLFCLYLYLLILTVTTCINQLLLSHMPTVPGYCSLICFEVWYQVFFRLGR